MRPAGRSPIPTGRLGSFDTSFLTDERGGAHMAIRVVLIFAGEAPDEAGTSSPTYPHRRLPPPVALLNKRSAGGDAPTG